MDPVACARIRRVGHFADSMESTRDVNAVIGFYRHWIIEPFLAKSGNVHAILDVGAGYGWLSIAFALQPTSRVAARIVAMEPNEPRLRAAREIATIAGVADRIEWCTASLGKMPFPNASFDAVFAIEVIEHIYKSKPMMDDLARVSKERLLITTPNRLFPIIQHDTALPFCHWLPPHWRRTYAAAWGKADHDGNLFWSPGELAKALPEFRPVTSFMHFNRWSDYVTANRSLGAEFRDSQVREILYLLASRFGCLMLPTISLQLERYAGFVPRTEPRRGNVLVER